MAKKKPAAKAQERAPQQTVSTANLTLPAGFKVKRQITVPTLVMKENTNPGPLLLRIEDKMRISSYVDPDPAKKKEKPATVCGVTLMSDSGNLVAGEVFQFLVPSVVESNLRRDYDAAVEIEGEGKDAKIVSDEGEHTYVGKVFRVQCLGKRPGKRYRDFSIFEVEAE